MFYALEELLAKMGVPEVKHRNRIEWHYFDETFTDLAGYAEVRLEEEGRRLVVEQSRTRENYEDDHGNIHAQYEETFSMTAEHVGEDLYRVTNLSYDGNAWDTPPVPMVELALSVFHARALDISILMVEQNFNKQDIADIAAEEQPEGPFGRRAIFSRLDDAPQRVASFGVVIPFRPREQQRRAM